MSRSEWDTVWAEVARAVSRRSSCDRAQVGCADCAKLVSNSGVVKVIILRELEPHRLDPIPYLTSCGLEVEVRSCN